MDIKSDLLRLKNKPALSKVDAFLSELPDEDKEVLLSVLNDISVSTRAIAKILAAHGHQIGRGSIDAWRHINVPLFYTRSTHSLGGNK